MLCCTVYRKIIDVKFGIAYLKKFRAIFDFSLQLLRGLQYVLCRIEENSRYGTFWIRSTVSILASLVLT